MSPEFVAALASHLCVEHGVKHVKGCAGCLDYMACYQRLRRVHGPRSVPVRAVRAKIRALWAAHWTNPEIAAAMGGQARESTIRRIMNPPRRDGSRRGGFRVSKDTEVRILAIRADQIPAARRVRVDATGTMRMLDAMRLRGFSRAAVASGAGFSESSGVHWSMPTVSGPVAAAVKTFYEAHLGETVPGRGVVVARAVAAGALPDRMWTPATIDDPAFDPLAPLPDPVGVRRRLRAMVRDGHGVGQLAARLGEPARVVGGWIGDAVVPCYARHLVVAVFLELEDEVGADRDAAGRAAELGWPASLDWYGVDIDRPAAKPVDVDGRVRPRDEVNVDYVNGALSGHVPRAELTTAELVEVVRRLAKTKTSRQIAEHLRWSPGQDPVRGQEAVTGFASWHRIDLVAGRDQGFSLGPKYGHRPTTRAAA